MYGKKIKKIFGFVDLFILFFYFLFAAYHRLEQTVRMKLMGWQKKVDVKPLSTVAAVDLGAELLGELVIFSIALGTLFFEYKRGQNKEKAKEVVQNQKLLSLQEQIDVLGVELRTQVTKQASLQNELYSLQKSLAYKDNKNQQKS